MAAVFQWVLSGHLLTVALNLHHSTACVCVCVCVYVSIMLLCTDMKLVCIHHTMYSTVVKNNGEEERNVCSQ